MSLSGSGTYDAPHSGDGNAHRPPWHPPIPSNELSSQVLMLSNTLTGRKEPFVPHEGRAVRWYTCGPTVYDASHVGHARTYLSLDIMRRIMSDYLRYNVIYQINVTDVDDKIILRARQNVLLERLAEDSSVDVKGMAEVAEKALHEAQDKVSDKKASLELSLKNAMDSRTRKESEELLKQLKLKTENLQKVASSVEEAIKSNNRSEIFESAKSVLGDWLDSRHGATVTERAVFVKHARHYEREFMQDMDALGIRPPDVLTRVTEYIDPIVAFIQKIVDRDLAYASPTGSVYLSLDRLAQAGHHYRKLSPAASATSADEMAEGEGALASSEAAEKRNPNDFALWKASKAGEPAWDSPWGPGRPGWHIECSVAATDILGQTIDIHAGGEDLKFPHHDNELAQSEACLGCQQWVNYFVHTGHLHIAGLKMSKSLKNFITIRQALENNTARQLRILFLLQEWDKPMNYSDQTVEDARYKENTFKVFFREIEALTRQDHLLTDVGWRMPAEDRQLAEDFMAVQQTVHASLLDNFNTKLAMFALLDMVAKVNVYLRLEGVKPAILLLRSIAVYVTQILRVFGVVTGADDFGFDSAESSSGAKDETESVIDCLVTFRERVRNAALAAAKGNGDCAQAAIRAILEHCDHLRDEVLPTVGVRLEDRPAGTRWNREDPGVMMRELAEKKAREKELRISKLEKTLVAKEKELERLKAAMVKPDDLFRTDEYKEWDTSGIPITLANGEPVSKGQMKKNTKAIEKQAKAYEDLMAKCDRNPQKLSDAIQREVDGIKNELATLSL